tara:strand:+ start:87644 stop:88183 length:540 start_codon:yes stop_codon:yes gene_type:complete
MKLLQKILLASLIVVTMNACKKTYDEGPTISFRSKKNRITGKWRLVSIEGVPRLNPGVEQYMELTKEPLGDGKYKAYFTNFQEEFCSFSPDSTGEALFTSDGFWKFSDGAFGAACNIGEYLKKNEGLGLGINAGSNMMVGEKWKILRLTNKELKIINNVCINDPCAYYLNNRTLIFEKE